MAQEKPKQIIKQIEAAGAAFDILLFYAFFGGIGNLILKALSNW